MQAAHHLAKQFLPDYSCKFSRHDFTLPQLFACLVVKEHQGRSYRGAEALLEDSPTWRHAVGLRRAPDHNTLCRAAKALLRQGRVERFLDVVARLASIARLLGLSMRTHTGGGSDCPFWDPLVVGAWKRVFPQRLTAVGDAGFDSEANHRIARQELGVRSIIPPLVGRPTDRPAEGYWRRHMQGRFERGADAKVYGQRWQVETVNSMMKRNLGSALRGRTAHSRKRDLSLKVITHNVMIL